MCIKIGWRYFSQFNVKHKFFSDVDHASGIYKINKSSLTPTVVYTFSNLKIDICSTYHTKKNFISNNLLLQRDLEIRTLMFWTFSLNLVFKFPNCSCVVFDIIFSSALILTFRLKIRECGLWAKVLLLNLNYAIMII